MTEHPMVKTEIALVGTEDLRKEMEKLEARKQLAIQDLLKEWSDLETSTPARIKEIQGELKALGWKRPRAPRKEVAGE